MVVDFCRDNGDRMVISQAVDAQTDAFPTGLDLKVETDCLNGFNEVILDGYGQSPLER